METMEQVVSQRGWTMVGAQSTEGSATRALVEWPAGAAGQAAGQAAGPQGSAGLVEASSVEPEQTRGLLYRFSDPITNRRVAWCHESGNAAQLFAVPEIIEAGDEWCLVQAIDGVPLLDWLRDRDANAASDSRRRKLLKQAGTLLRKLHELKSSVYGEVLPEARRARYVNGEWEHHGQWRTFNGFIAAQLDFFSEAINAGPFSEDTRSALLYCLGELRHELSAFHPRHSASLNHGSFSLAHLWVDESGRELVGLTGFEYACYLPPEADIAYLLWIEGIAYDELLTRDFYAGYGAARTMDVQRREGFFRRLVALQVMFGLKGDAPIEQQALLELIVS